MRDVERLRSTGKPVLDSCHPKLLSVPVDVEIDSQFQEISLEERDALLGSGLLSSQVTIPAEGVIPCQSESGRLYLELSSATPVSVSLIPGPTFPESVSITDPGNALGQSIRLENLELCPSSSMKSRTEATGRSRFVAFLLVIPTWVRSMISPTSRAGRQSIRSGWIHSLLRRWRGGTKTTVHSETEQPSFTLKGTVRGSASSLPSGSVGEGSEPDTHSPKRVQDSSLSAFGKDPQSSSSLSYDHSSSRDFYTNWATVDSVGSCEDVHVYDIEVEGNHNFVANGMLVHNCHRTGAPSWCELTKLVPAKYRLGLTATPRRKDGLMQAFLWSLGMVDTVVDANLVVPEIYQLWMPPLCPLIKDRRGKPMASKMLSLLMGTSSETVPGKKTKRTISKPNNGSNKRDSIVVPEIAQALKKDRKVLILSDRIPHLMRMGEMLKAYGDWSQDYYIGGRKKVERDIAEKAQCIWATFAMAQEGLDIPAIDTLVLAGPKGDVEQAVGRAMRPHPDKDRVIVLDFCDDVSPFANMGKKRSKFYENKGWKVTKLTRG